MHGREGLIVTLAEDQGCCPPLYEIGIVLGEVHLVIAEVVWVWFSDDVLNENERIDPLKLAPISRLGLRSFLKTVPEGIYSLPRISAEEYAALDGNS